MTESYRTMQMVSRTENVISYQRGEVILKEGSYGNCMYLIRSGEVELSFHGTPLPSLGEGGILGEMAILGDEPRTATAIALTDCELVPIDRARFLYLLQQAPDFALEVMRTMAHRLRETNLLLQSHGRIAA